MSRLPDPEHEPAPDPPKPGGRIGTTRPGVLISLGLTALVLGWLLRPASQPFTDVAPRVGWLPVLALWLAAAILVGVAWSTYRTLHRRNLRLPAHQAVNRLVLAKASAIAGSVVAGGYLGYALSWIGLTDAPLEVQRLLHSALAGLAGVVIVAASLALERACRVRSDDDENLR